MILTRDVFTIDCKAESEKIEAFISAKMLKLRRDGIVVAISGGLDSSTVIGLCVRAVGNRKVTGLNLPERNGNPDALEFTQLMAGRGFQNENHRNFKNIGRAGNV